MVAEEVVAAYAPALFVRSEAEIRRPVVLLSGERTNVYGVLEKHFRETALPPSERFWRVVRGHWTPALETWRPRVNGTQLKVLSGARLPESDEEWGAVRTALNSVRQHLRSDTSVDRLHAELRDFVGMVVAWWENRKKTENNSGNGMLMKRVASAGMLLAPLGLPLSKKVCLEYAPLAPGQHLPGQHFHPALPSPAQQPQYHHHGGSVYAAPEIVSHPLLGGGGGSGRLPDRLLPSPAAGAGADGDLQAQQQQQHNGTMHGGGGYLQQLTSTTSDLQLFGQLFGGGGGDGRGSQSPREDMQGNGTGLLDAGADGYQLPEAQREGSAENKEPAGRDGGGATADSGKRFVSLNVGGYRFETTAATLAAVDGSYFSKLARQAAGAAGSGAEFFVDRSGKIFEYVLDHLRARRFADCASALPRDERTLQLLAREAAFYQLPELAERAQAALVALASASAAAAAVAAGGEDTPSDMPTNTGPDGSAHGGQLLLGRLGGAGSIAQAPIAAGAAALDALFLETGFHQAAELAEAQGALLQQLNSTLAAKQGEGFSVADVRCGTERDGPRRNLHYHVLLCKASSA